MRRAEPRYPAAFLVDQDRGIRLAEATPQFLNKRRYLSRRLDIAFEQDKAPWPLATDEFALGCAQFQSGYARDECAAAHGAD